ncbi:MAG: Hsp20/alpha crystallin family protein [Candidatus Jordarchaeum sp.]|uniref:Hsp20/alpha crystallin family protein n=1 Tax=Candidatus Jordarchaeum sp. TaxID=2823881 RepID=UPI00404B2C6D
MSKTEDKKESTEIEPFGSRRDIYRPFEDIFEDFRKSFDALLRPWFDIVPARRIVEFRPLSRFPRLDLEDNGDGYTVTAEVPGLSKDQVNLNLTKDSLDISGEISEEKEEKDKSYLHRERSYQSFRRCIVFPEEVIPEKAEAEIKKGILTLKVPKKEPTPKEEPVKVDIKEED